MLPEKLNDDRDNIQELLAIWRIDQEIAYRIDPSIVSSAKIFTEINRIEALPVVPELEDRQDEAKLIKDETLFLLYRKYSLAKHYEAERAWIAKEDATEIGDAAHLVFEQERSKRKDEAEAINRRIQEKAQARREGQENERKRHLLSGSWPKVEFVDRDEYERCNTAATATNQAEAKSQAWHAHEAVIHRVVLGDLCDIGLAAATARSLITAIARGEVPHLTLTY